MDTCSNNLCLDSDWQATAVVFLMNLRNAILAIPEDSSKIYQQVPKALTRGASYMICVVLIFVLLTLMGSAITVHEFLVTYCARNSDLDEDYTGISRKVLKYKSAKKSPKISTGWIDGLKSFLSCFCILKNGRKILETSSNKIQFECINGFRSLNNFWVIFLHICMAYMSALKIGLELKPLVGMRSYQLVMNGQYAVDVFFVLSGFLNAYSFFNNYDKSSGNVSWFHFYIKRFVRLTPVYMVVFGFYTFLYPYMGSGPIWPTFDTNPVCRQNWLWNLLYINNFIHHTRQCMEWCWYLAADMQFYIISPIFLISLMRNPVLGYVLTGACIVASCLTSFIITKQYNLVDGLSRMEYHFADMNVFYDRYWTYYDLVYTKPYTRISSYLVAILLAHYLYKRNFNIKCSKIILCIGWTATGILWFIAYFALFKREESITENAIYNSIKHLFYSIGLSWVLFVCLTVKEGFLNRCLSWKFFSPLSKLSYCAFLIHLILIMRYYQTAKYLEDFCVSSLLIFSAHIYFWTYVFSFVTSLLFEFPVLNLLDLISKKQQTIKKLY